MTEENIAFQTALKWALRSIPPIHMEIDSIIASKSRGGLIGT